MERADAPWPPVRTALSALSKRRTELRYSETPLIPTIHRNGSLPSKVIALVDRTEWPKHL